MYSPKIPYFCFHEYKRENEPKGDPAAQALSAMLAAQTLNPPPPSDVWVICGGQNATACGRIREVIRYATPGVPSITWEDVLQGVDWDSPLEVGKGSTDCPPPTVISTKKQITRC